MPSTSTITSFYEFAPSTVIKSAEMNNNFQNFRGHYLPINTDTSTASDLTHNLGANDHYWKSSYVQEHYQKEISTGSTPSANSFNTYFKSDGKKYKKNSAALERSFLDTDLVLAKGDLLVGLGANTLTALTIGANAYVLTADSATTTGMAWKQNVSTLLTTKGDLFAFDTAPARLPIGTDGQVLTADSSTTTGMKWETKSSGSGINYILNPNGDSAISGWATFADAAASSPVDGTGGSPSNTFEVSATSPLRGVGSFLWTKSANNRQGEGFSYDFTIDSADQAKVLTLSFDYKIASGTYADDALSAWVYDVTNGTLIQPAPTFIKNSTLAETFTGEFQTSPNSTSYRLIIFTRATDTNAYSVQFDNFFLGRANKVNGTPITDWVSYTPTLTNITPSGSGVQTNGKYRRVGDSMQIQIFVAMGSTGSGTAGDVAFSYPSGFTADTAKMARSGGSQALGNCIWFDSSATIGYAGNVNGVSSVMNIFLGDGTNWGGNPIQGNQIGSNDSFSFTATVPIVGWASTTVMSNDADTRVVACKVFRSTTGQAVSGSSDVKIQWNGVAKDSHGTFDATTNYRYTVPVSGTYQLQGFMEATAVASPINININLYKNGGPIGTNSLFAQTGALPSGTFNFQDDAKVGDYYELFINPAGQSLTIISDASIYGGVTWNITRISGPAQIAASETVACEYNTAAGGTLVDGNATFIDFGVKESDTHNSVVGAGNGNSTTYTNTWRFIAPISGRYHVDAVVAVAAVGGNILYHTALICKNGTSLHYGSYIYLPTAVSTTYASTASAVVRLNAGESISIAAVMGNGANRQQTTSAALNRVSICRVGNY